jgi:5-methylcytosine-specific restriction endonuclease McrA
MAGEAETITRICQSIAAGRLDDAVATLKQDYPFSARLPVGGSQDKATATRVFVRDGFIDRYTGDRLVFPGVLRLLSQLFPDDFPFHTNWKLSATHPAYWELYPTVDHIVSIARGGTHDDTNRVTTSMMRNSAKGVWTLGELGWQLYPAGDVKQWDGLMGWFVRFVEADTRLLTMASVRPWHRAALAARGT